MRVGQSIWAREEAHLHDRTGSLLFATTRSKEFLRHHSNPELLDSFDDDHPEYEQGPTLPKPTRSIQVKAFSPTSIREISHTKNISR